jgi:hypothetical protein
MDECRYRPAERQKTAQRHKGDKQEVRGHDTAGK